MSTDDTIDLEAPSIRLSAQAFFLKAPPEFAQSREGELLRKALLRSDNEHEAARDLRSLRRSFELDKLERQVGAYAKFVDGVRRMHKDFSGEPMNAQQMSMFLSILDVGLHRCATALREEGEHAPTD